MCFKKRRSPKWFWKPRQTVLKEWISLTRQKELERTGISSALIYERQSTAIQDILQTGTDVQDRHDVQKASPGSVDDTHLREGTRHGKKTINFVQNIASKKM